MFPTQIKFPKLRLNHILQLNTYLYALLVGFLATSLYGVILLVSSIFTGTVADPTLHRIIALALLLVCFLSAILGEQTTKEPGGKTTLNRRFDIMGNFLLEGGFVFSCIGSIPNGFFYTFETRNPVGVGIFILAVVLGAYLSFEAWQTRRAGLRDALNYNVTIVTEPWMPNNTAWDFLRLEILLILWVILVNGIMRTLTTLTWSGFAIFVAVEILLAIIGFALGGETPVDDEEQSNSN